MTTSRKLGLAAVLAFLAYLVIGKGVLLYTEWLWFSQLTFGQVFVKVLTARVWVFLLVSVIVFLCVWPQCHIARKFSRDLPVPILTRLIPLDDKLMLDRYVDRYLFLVLLLFSAAGGLMASGRWDYLLRFANAVPFGSTDPIFHKEIAFYVLRLPFWQLLWQAVYAGAILGLIGAALIYIYDDIIQLASERAYIAPKALGHLSLTAALVFVLKGVGYQFNAWKLLYSTRGVTHGVGYVDAHVFLPAYRVLLVAALVVAAVLAWNYRRQSFKLGVGAVGAHLALSVLLLGVIPGAVQKLIVTPNELQKEAPYIQHNIKLTREAYGLANISTVHHPGRTTLTPQDLTKNELTLSNIRIWDDRPLRQTYQQLQGIRPYYSFADVDIDRYTINGQYRQVMLGARSLSHERIPRRTWVNDHLKYTHGYGICMNPVNYAGKEGQPDFFLKDIPPVSSVDLKLTRPEIYYDEDPDEAGRRRELAEEAQARQAEEGKGAPSPTPQRPTPELAGEEHRSDSPDEGQGPQDESPLPPLSKLLRPPRPRGGVEPEQALATWLDYIIVDSSTEEFDYPKGDKNVTCRYRGKGGVLVNSVFRKLAFGWRFSNLKIPLSGYVRRDTRILYHRRIMDRCRTIAPFLRYDRDPYVVLAEGKLYWIVDAYATTDMYPYSERTRGIGNYVRNPVKVVLSAHDGDVKFYVIDPTEPLVQCFSRMFPGLFTSADKMPKSLRAHLRYPTGLFMIQSLLYSTYHMTQTDVFYNKEDQWELPREIFGEGIEQRVEAYYMVTKPPGIDREAFYLFLPMTPAGKDNVIAWMCANCDDPNYGKITVYNFPKDKVVYGPMQIEARIDQDEDISQDFTLWSQKGSRVIRGNVLVIPIEDSLLYVEPIYLQAERSELPELKRVIVASGNEVVMEPTLEGALERLFPGLAEQRATPLPGGGTEGAPSATTIAPVPTAAGAPKPSSADTRQQLIEQAAKLFDQAEAARQKGDFETYGKQTEELGRVLGKLRSAK
ncbi:MAG: UPF0182 family protein [Armatimonadetes bacterium]|nr:UPF0182 family protein [Armatimonadota bacterium]NCP31883.1 UPF0182 family protein [Armatimonadota bacterium]